MSKLVLPLSLFIMTLSSWASSAERSSEYVDETKINGAETDSAWQVSQNTFSTDGERSPGKNDPQRRSGLGQDSSRKIGYSSKRKDVSADNTPRSPGIDKSQRTPGSEKYIITKKKKRKMEKSKRVKEERQRLEKKEVKSNPFSDYRK